MTKPTLNHPPLASFRIIEYGRGITGLKMGATLRQNVIDFWGGNHGRHSIVNDGNLDRINGHWIGYVKNSRASASPLKITRWLLNRAELKTGVELSKDKDQPANPSNAPDYDAPEEGDTGSYGAI